MRTFVVGDVVRLKSGGPQMVVSEVVSATNPNTKELVEVVSCRWFNSEQVPQLVDCDSRELIKEY